MKEGISSGNQVWRPWLLAVGTSVILMAGAGPLKATGLALGWERLFTAGARIATEAGQAVMRPFQAISFIANGVVELDQLRQERAQYQAQKAQWQQVNQQLTELRGISAGNPGASGRWFVTATPATSLVVLGGTNEGLSQNAMVRDRNGWVVGRIAGLSRYQSQVRELGAVGETTGVKLSGSGQEGVLVGDGRNGILESIPPGTVILLGEMVLTSGVDAKYPAGEPVGQVEAIISKPAEAMMRFKIKLTEARQGWVRVD